MVALVVALWVRRKGGEGAKAGWIRAVAGIRDIDIPSRSSIHSRVIFSGLALASSAYEFPFIEGVSTDIIVGSFLPACFREE